MIRPVGRATALLLVTPFLTFASALAPQHVHEPGPGHEHALAHSHFGPHELDVHQTDDIEIETDIEHVVWLDSAVLHESPYQSAPVLPEIPVSYDIVRVDAHWSVTSFDDVAPAHGPPKAVQLLRGPPLFLA